MNLWANSVDLFNLTERFISGDGTILPAYIYNKWSDNKAVLLNPVKVPPRSSSSEQKLKEASKTPISVDDDSSQTMLLEQSFIDESLILSALFELDELEAGRLLRLAESLQSDWPEWPRGLVAVILFYDMRLRRASTLKLLLQECINSRGGQCSRFFEQLVQDGLILSLIEILRGLHEEGEIERLDSVQALGSIEHRREVAMSYRQFLRNINDVILGWSTENSMKVNEVTAIFQGLGSYDPPKFESPPRGAPDSLVGLLASLTATCLSQKSGNGRLFGNVRSALEAIDFLCLPLKGFVKLVIAIANGSREGKLSQDDQQMQHYFFEAFRAGAFHFFIKFIAPCTWLIQSGDLCDVFSYMFIFFLSTQHPILRSLITGSAEDRQDEGYSVSLRNEFTDINQLLSPTHGHSQAPKEEPDSISTLFEAITAFYKVAGKVIPDSVVPYWTSFNRAVQPGVSEKDRHLYLSMFVSFAGDILSADKYSKYVSMITALISSDESTATGAFHFLVDNCAANSDRRRVSIQHFQFTFQNVAAFLHQLNAQGNAASNAASSFDETELEALCATVKLLTKLAKHSLQCRMELYSMFIANTFSLITSSVPSMLKVHLFEFAAALIGQVQHSIQIWDIVDQSQLIPAADATGQYTGGMWTELCSIEARLCAFPVTASFLDLLASLLVYNVPIVLTERGIFEPIISFVVEGVLPRLTNTSTTPSSQAELWRVASPCFLILTRLLEHLVVLLSPSADPTSLWAGNLLLQHPGFLVYRALLRAGSSLFKNSIKLLKLSHSALYHEPELPDYADQISAAASHILSLFKICLENADLLDKRLLTLPSFGADCHLSISQMLTSVESTTSSGSVGVLRSFVALLNFVGNSDSLLTPHCLIALNILSVLFSKTDCHAAIYNYLTLDIPLQILTITKFVNCIEGNVGVYESDSKSKLVKDIQILTMDIIGQILLKMPAPNVAYILLGLFYRRPVVSSTLIELETGQVVKTCFKSIVAHLALTNDVDVSYQGYRVLQRLCANEKTSVPVLNLLRASPSFLLSQIIEGQLVDSMLSTADVSSKQYLAVAGLFHCLTVDLHMCSTSQLDLKSYVLKAAQILLQATSNFGTNAPLLLAVVQKLPFSHESADLVPIEKFCSFVGRPLAQLIRLLGSVNVESDNSEGVRLSLFDVHRLHSALAGIKAEFLASQQASTQTQPELVAQMDELVEEVMRYAAECNAKTELLHARVCFFENWRRLMETVVTVVRSDVEATASICFDIATVLLDKVLQSDSSDLFFPNACSFVASSAEIIAISSCSFDSTSPLTHLLKSVVSAIVFTRKANSGLESRAHLYGFLLKFADINLKVMRHLFENADENLLQVVLFDCTSNSAHTRLACLAYCLLQKFVRLDQSGRTFDALKSSKHIANICVSMANSSPTGEQYRLLEARFAFLTTLCLMSSETCLLVVNSRPLDGILGYNFNRISAVQNQQSSESSQNAVLTPVEHARLVNCFYSVLDFISSIFSTLLYNRLVAGEVARFVLENSVLFAELLSKPSNLNLEWLEVSSKAFAIVCRCLSVLKNAIGNSSQVSTGVSLELGPEASAKLSQLKDTVLQALVAYSDINDISMTLEHARPVEQMVFMLPISRIQESLLMYVAELINVAAAPVSDSSPSALLQSLVFSVTSISHNQKQNSKSFRPDLIHLVRFLNNVAVFAERLTADLKSVSNLLHDLDSLSLKEINEVIAAWHLHGASAVDSLMPQIECREIARSMLETAAESLVRRLSVVANNLNLTLIVLLRHFDIYLDIAGNESKTQSLGMSHEAAGRLMRSTIETCPDSCIMQLHHTVGQLASFASEARISDLTQLEDSELASSLLRRIRKLTTGAKQKLDNGHFGLPENNSPYRIM